MSDYDRRLNKFYADFADFVALSPRSPFLYYQTKLQRAQSYAASVRARNPQMVVKRLTERKA